MSPNSRHVQLGGGNVIAYGHWGRPVLAFPSEQGPCWQYEERGMVDAIGSLLESGPDQALLRRQLGRGHMAGARRPARGARSPARRLRGLDPRRGRPVDHRRRRRGGRDPAHGSQLRGLPRGELRPQARRPVPDRDLPERRVRRVGRRLGRARRRRLLQQPDGLRRPPPRRPPHLAPRPGLDRARLRQRPVGGHDGRAREHAPLLGVLADKGIRHEIDVWGPEFPHDWPAWRTQLAHHLPRFC